MHSHWVYCLQVVEELAVERPLSAIGRNGVWVLSYSGLHPEGTQRQHQQPVSRTDRMSAWLACRVFVGQKCSEPVPTPRMDNSCAWKCHSPQLGPHNKGSEQKGKAIQPRRCLYGGRSRPGRILGHSATGLRKGVFLDPACINSKVFWFCCCLLFVCRLFSFFSFMSQLMTLGPIS